MTRTSVNAHYLKGSIYCGLRLIFSRNQGKTGKYYDYFICIGRHRRRTNCARKAVLVSRVEDYYRSFAVPAEQIEEIRAGVEEEFARLQAVAGTDLARSRRRLQQVQDQRQKLLDARYRGAIPVDILRNEMSRLTSELASAETELSTANATLTDLQGSSSAPSQRPATAPRPTTTHHQPSDASSIKASSRSSTSLKTGAWTALICANRSQPC